MLNKVIKINKMVFEVLIHLLSSIVPKKNNCWVFGAWYGKKYSDNSKAFFEYVVSHQPHIKAIWITKDKDLLLSLNGRNLNALYYLSFFGIWYQMRASFAFVCQALPDDLFSPAIGKKTKVVNLWHGLPLKKIMYDVFDAPNTGANFFGRLETALTPFNRLRNDYLIATSEETQRTLSKAFNIPLEHTLITGFPRNDILIDTEKVPPKANSFSCIYMPTFRGGIGDECDLFTQYGFSVEQIDKELQRNNIKLFLRMHPVNQPPATLISEINQSKSIAFDNVEDVFETLPYYDCMITDYSGAYFDFLLMNKPILFAPFDLADYMKTERDLYYDYKSVTLEPYSYNWEDLIQNLISAAKAANKHSSTSEYCRLRTLFHQELPIEHVSFSESLFHKLKSL